MLFRLASKVALYGIIIRLVLHSTMCYDLLCISLRIATCFELHFVRPCNPLCIAPRFAFRSALHCLAVLFAMYWIPLYIPLYIPTRFALHPALHCLALLFAMYCMPLRITFRFIFRFTFRLALYCTLIHFAVHAPSYFFPLYSPLRFVLYSVSLCILLAPFCVAFRIATPSVSFIITIHFASCRIQLPPRSVSRYHRLRLVLHSTSICA
jgi:hypothetical protein